MVVESNFQAKKGELTLTLENTSRQTDFELRFEDENRAIHMVVPSRQMEDKLENAEYSGINLKNEIASGMQSDIQLDTGSNSESDIELEAEFNDDSDIEEMIDYNREIGSRMVVESDFEAEESESEKSDFHTIHDLSFLGLYELVVTSKILLFQLTNTDSSRFERMDCGNNQIVDSHFIIDTKDVMNIIHQFKYQVKWIAIDQDIHKLVNFSFLVFQKIWTTSSWYFDLYCPSIKVIEHIGNLMFCRNTTLNLVGTNYQFFAYWKPHAIKLENGELRVEIDQPSFNQKIASLKTVPHYPRLIWLNRPVLQIPNVVASFANFAPKNSFDSQYDEIAKDEQFVKSITMDLSKQEVSAIIGRKGCRINSLRMETNCLIVILPIDASMKYLPQRSIRQQIFISGPRECVDVAIETMKTFLATWRHSKKKYIE